MERTKWASDNLLRYITDVSATLERLQWGDPQWRLAIPNLFFLSFLEILHGMHVDVVHVGTDQSETSPIRGENWECFLIPWTAAWFLTACQRWRGGILRLACQSFLRRGGSQLLLHRRLKKSYTDDIVRSVTWVYWYILLVLSLLIHTWMYIYIYICTYIR